MTSSSQIIQKSSALSNYKENSTSNETSKLSTLKKSRKPRRSKEFKDGRNFICIICNKAYLSRPALHNHQKTKHSPDEFKSLPLGCTESSHLNGISKKRGRPPKKNISYLLQIENFLLSPKRKINNSNLDNCVLLKQIEQGMNNSKIDFVNNYNHNNINYNSENIVDPFTEFLSFMYPITNEKFHSFASKILNLYKEYDKLSGK